MTKIKTEQKWKRVWMKEENRQRDGDLGSGNCLGRRLKEQYQWIQQYTLNAKNCSGPGQSNNTTVLPPLY